jgi:hypothetical protein
VIGPVLFEQLFGLRARMYSCACACRVTPHSPVHRSRSCAGLCQARVSHPTEAGRAPMTSTVFECRSKRRTVHAVVSPATARIVPTRALNNAHRVSWW